MTSLALRLAVVAAVLAATSLSALAGSIATSSAAGGSSASSAASATSDSIGDSSASSAKAVAQADGPYRVVDVTPVPDRPGTVRMKLQALAPAEGTGTDGTLVLFVPQQAIERGGVTAGATVTASQRPYGTAFAHLDTRREFFLVLHEAWHRELRSNPVSL
jgi:hypothetical protein